MKELWLLRSRSCLEDKRNLGVSTCTHTSYIYIVEAPFNASAWFYTLLRLIVPLPSLLNFSHINVDMV